MTILCHEIAHFEFSEISNVSISGLKFDSCSANVANSIGQLTIEHSKFVGSNSGGVSNNESFNSGRCSNVVGGRDFTPFFEYLTNFPEAFVGGALIVTYSTLIIDHTDFEENIANVGGAIFSLSSSISVSDSNFISNSASGCKYDLCFGGAFFSC